MSLENKVNDIINSTQRVMVIDIPQDEINDLLKFISDKITSTIVMIDYLKEANQLLYVFLIEEDNYIILKSQISNIIIQSITRIHPEALIFEYELQNQFGFNIKNIIQDNSFRFINSNSKGIKFNIDIRSQTMEQVSVSLGKFYREIEHNLVSSNLEEMFSKMSIYFGNCSSAHQICLIHCVEDLINHEISEFNIKSRILVLELERCINHILWMIMVLFDLGFKDAAKEFIEVRKELISTKMEILGNRSASSWIVNPIYYEENRDNIINKLKNSMDSLNLVHNSEQLDVGHEYIDQAFNPLPKQVNEYGLVGPLARANGFKQDMRRKSPFYANVKVTTPKSPRNIFDVRLRESISSITMALEIIESNLIPARQQINYSQSLKINTYSVRSVEAPNGRLTYLIHTDGNGVIDHIRISIPCFVNLPSLKYFIKDKKLKWFPIILRIFDMGIDPLDDIQIQDEKGESVSPSAFSFRKLAQEAILQNKEINLTQK